MFKTTIRGILSFCRILPVELKEIEVPSRERKEDPVLKINIRIVQDADGEDCMLKEHTELEKAWAKEAERLLSENPSMIPLFQNGAILEVGVKEPHPEAEFITCYMGVQIAGIRKKNPKDTRRDYGFMGISRLRTKDIPYCCFDVRLVKTGVPG